MAVVPDSCNKTMVSAHGMGSGGLAVDAMEIGCLGVEHCGERFFVLSHFHPTPGSSRLGIEPKTPGWLVQDPTVEIQTPWSVGLFVLIGTK